MAPSLLFEFLSEEYDVGILTTNVHTVLVKSNNWREQS